MLTAYDACFATQQQSAGVDVLLVGDSLGMVLQGQESTVPVTIKDMVYHTRCVAQGLRNTSQQQPSSTSRPLIMADMPFMGCATLEKALNYSTKLMQAGAHMVKLEGEAWLTTAIQQLAQGGIPVCAHLGLTPQSVNTLGGYKIQGRGDDASQTLIQHALDVEAAGAAMLLVECIPANLGQTLSKKLSIPVIGIGAGPDCDGQVLVMHDMLGITPGKPARFVHNFMQGADTIQGAFAAYVSAVKSKTFPAEEHCFS